MVYKNIYPEDFSKLMNNTGILYNTFRSTNTQKKMIVNNIHSEIEKYKESLTRFEEESLLSVNEIKVLFLSGITDNKKVINYIENSSDNYNIDAILSDEFYISKLAKGKIRVFFNDGTHLTNISLEDINLKLKCDIVKREGEIRSRNTKKTTALREKINSLNMNIRDIEQYSTKDIMDSYGIDDYPNEFKEAKVLVYLVRNGYIDESYSSYISAFYSISLTKDEMDFIMQVKNQDSPNYKIKLVNPNKVIDRLYLKEFGIRSILNFTLLEYLLANIDEYTRNKDEIFILLASEDNVFIFIDEFYEITKNKAIFIAELCKKWEGIWRYIETKANLTASKMDSYLIDIIQYVDVDVIKEIESAGQISKYISNSPNFISLLSSESLNKIMIVIKDLDVKFCMLTNLGDNIEFANFIINNDLYEINTHMIFIIIHFLKMELYEQAKQRNFSVIKSISIKVYQYIDQNIELYIENVFLKLQDNIIEDESSIVELLNHKNLSIINKEMIIVKEQFTLSSINIVQNDLWAHLLRYDHVFYSWQNLFLYYKYTSEIDDILIQFIKSCYIELSNQQVSDNEIITNDDIASFIEEFTDYDEISDQIYRKILKSFSYEFDSYELSLITSSRVEIMILNGLIGLTQHNLEQIRKYHKSKVVLFIQKHIRRYLDQINEYELDNDDLLDVLSSNKIDEQNRILILRIKNAVVRCSDVKNTRSICNLILSAEPKINLNADMMTTVMSSNIEQDIKVKVLNNQIDIILENQPMLDTYLSNIGDPYSLLTQRKKVLLVNNQENLSLVRSLHKKSYIVFYKKEDKMLRINHRA